MFRVFVASGIVSLLSTASASVVDHVVQLEQSTFSEFVENNKHVIVKFYAPWCVHCKQMAQDFAAAAKLLNDKESPIKLAKVDATEQQELAEKYEIKGYPTLLFFRSGVAEEYTGGRQASDIVAWAEKMTGPVLQHIDDESLLPELERDMGIFVGYFNDENDLLYRGFKNAASKLRNHGKFHAILKNDVKSHIKILRKDEDPHILHEPDENSIIRFVNSERIPLYAPISFENFKNYFDNNYTLAWVCGDISWFERTASNMRKIAREYREDFAFVFLDVVEFKGHAESYLAVHEFPSFVVHGPQGRYIMKHSTNKTENLQEEITDFDKIKEFIRNVKEGKLERHFKSEEIPPESAEPVKIVVGNNFENVVLNSGKDVMLQIHAPWCGYCKSLAPIYQELAEKLKNDDSIIIAKMDGTTNESPVPNFTWDAFPFIYYIKAEDKVPQKYQGKRTLDAMLAFIESNRSKTSEQSAMSDEL